MPHGVNLTEICTLILVSQVFSPAKIIFAGVGVLLSVRSLPDIFCAANVTPIPLRQLRMFGQAKIHSLTSSSASRTSSDVSRSTRMCRQLQK